MDDESKYLHTGRDTRRIIQPWGAFIGILASWDNCKVYFSCAPIAWP